MSTQARKLDATKCTIFLRGVPAELRRAFKAWCNLHNVLMIDTCVDLMRKVAKKEEVPAGAWPNGTPGIFYLFGVPRQVRNHFKAWCELRGVTMAEKMVSMLAGLVSTPPPEKKK